MTTHSELTALRLTPARRAWLEKLASEGPCKRRRGTVGITCMRQGWTEWDYRLDGKPITEADARERFGNLWFEHVEHNWLERITPAGRARLAQVTE